MKYKLLILYLLISFPSAILAESPRLQYSTLLGQYRVEGERDADRDIFADVDRDGNLYVFVNQMAPPDSTWPQYNDDDVWRLLRINHDGSGVDLVADIPDIRVRNIRCDPNGDIFLNYSSFDEDGEVLKKISPDGEELGEIVLPVAYFHYYIDQEGNVYVTGYVSSERAHTIPVTGDAMFGSFIGDDDIFIMKYNTSFDLVYCSFLGGTGGDAPDGVIANSEGRIILSCHLSEDFVYLPNEQDERESPAVLIFTPDLKEIVFGWRDYYAFRPVGPAVVYEPNTGSIYNKYGDYGICKFYPTGDCEWLFSFDGSEYETKYFPKHFPSKITAGIGYDGVAADESGNVYFTMKTEGSDYPVTPDALFPNNNGWSDITVNRVNSKGKMEYATYFGGSGDEYSWPLATACRNGVFYCAGITNSDDFPTTPGAYLDHRLNNQWGYDVFAFAIDFNDFTVNVADETGAAPAPLALDPPHPNPFNPQTTLSFTLPEAGFARLTVYNLSGQLVRELAAETLPAGRHEIVWDGRDADDARVASGIYIARLAAGGRSAVRKVTLVR